MFNYRKSRFYKQDKADAYALRSAKNRYKRSRYASRPVPSGSYLVRKPEVKMYTIAGENLQLYHNTGIGGYAFSGPVLFNPWNQVAGGSGRQQRIGDKIVPVRMDLKIWVANKLDRPNITYRVIVCILPKTFNNVRVGAGSIDIGSPVWSGTCGNYSILPVDEDKGITVLYDKTQLIQTGFNASNPTGTTFVGKEAHGYFDISIKRPRSGEIRYESNSTQDILNRPVAIYVIPYDSYGTLTTDNVSSCSFFCKLLFTDV